MKKVFILKTTILSLLTAGMIVVYFLGFSFLEKKSQRIADLQVSIDNEINKTQQSFNIKKQTDLVDELGKTIEKHFLKSPDVPIFLSSIEDIGSKTGADIIISSVEETTSVETGPILNLRIGASGSYQSVYKTLVEIENIPYLASISNLSISSDQTANTSIAKESWSLSLSLTVKSYIK